MASIATDVVFDFFDTSSSTSRTNDGNGELAVVLQAFSAVGDVDLAVSYNGVAMSERVVGDDADRVSIFTLANPATGANTLAITGLAASRRYRVWFVPTNDTVYLNAGFQNNGAATAASSGAITTTVGDLILCAVNIRSPSGADPTVVAANDAVQRSEGAITGASPSQWGWESSFTADDTSATLGATWTGSVASYLGWVQFENVAAAGPTIDTQPTAGTVVLNNDSRTSKTFTTAATTSGGALTYQWQKEDSVGAGTYTNITNGGIHAGATTASLVVTPTTKTGLTGIRYRCNVTDSNGTTTTDAVALTVYNGVILSAASAVTDASGIATITYTTDLPVTANGAFNKFIAVCDGATSRTSGRPS